LKHKSISGHAPNLTHTTLRNTCKHVSGYVTELLDHCHMFDETDVPTRSIYIRRQSQMQLLNCIGLGTLDLARARESFLTKTSPSSWAKGEFNVQFAYNECRLQVVLRLWKKGGFSKL